jgi:hypothetical protein
MGIPINMSSTTRSQCHHVTGAGQGSSGRKLARPLFHSSAVGTAIGASTNMPKISNPRTANATDCAQFSDPEHTRPWPIKAGARSVTITAPETSSRVATAAGRYLVAQFPR